MALISAGQSIPKRVNKDERGDWRDKTCNRVDTQIIARSTHPREQTEGEVRSDVAGLPLQYRETDISLCFLVTQTKWKRLDSIGSNLLSRDHN